MAKRGKGKTERLVFDWMRSRSRASQKAWETRWIEGSAPLGPKGRAFMVEYEKEQAKFEQEAESVPDSDRDVRPDAVRDDVPGAPAAESEEEDEDEEREFEEAYEPDFYEDSGDEWIVEDPIQTTGKKKT